MRTAWTFAGLLVVSVAAVTAGAADRFVTRSGTDSGNDCLTATSPCATVSRATSQASSGDTIKVATGQFHDNVRIASATSLIFLGGWDAAFASRNPLGTPSVLRGGRVPTALRHQDRVWGIFADAGAAISVTIDGFVVDKGRAGTSIPDVGVGLVGQGRAGGGLTAFAIDHSTISLTIQNTTIEGNRDEYGGAGLSLWALDGSSLSAVFDSVRIVKNRTTIPGAGGGVAAFSGTYVGPGGTVTLTLRNCLVAKNDGGDGGGGVLASGFNSSTAMMTVDIVSSTITKNVAHGPAMPLPGRPFGGGGIGAVSSGGHTTIRLLDAILYGNRLKGAATGADFYDFYPPPSMVTLSADHSDLGDVVLQDGPLGDLGGNVAVAPMLDKAYELLPGSPLINAGTCTGAPSTDFEGDPRPSGAGCDIGADEFQF